MYTTLQCPYCIRAKQLLEKKKIDFEEIRIDIDPTRMDEMISRSNGRRTVPQIFINGQLIGGCDDMYALELTGQLDQLLKG